MATALNGYETTFILKNDMPEDQQKAFVEKLQGIVTHHKGVVLVTEDWGRRRLAYPIQKETRGHYVHMVFSGDSGVVAELERNMRINEKVIRFLTVQLGRDFNAGEYKHRSTMRPTIEKPIERATPVVAERTSEEA